MGDLAAMIMSMDTLHLGGIGLATMGSIGLMAYSILKSKPINDNVEKSSALSDMALNYAPKLNIEEKFITNNQNDIPILKDRFMDASLQNEEVDLVQTALVYDSCGSKEEASQVLREAMEQESNAKEKVRLHVIHKNYITNEGTLSELIARYPTFIKKPINTDSVQIQTESKEKFDLFASKKDNDDSQQLLQGLQVEEVVRGFVSESENVDSLRTQEDEQDTERFFAEFGDLAQQIQEENKLIPQKSTEYSQEKEIYDVWANYMSLFGGRMNLKNTFIHLEHPWGTIPAIAELQEKINVEIGKDEYDNQIPWAIISVLPLKDSQK